MTISELSGLARSDVIFSSHTLEKDGLHPALWLVVFVDQTKPFSRKIVRGKRFFWLNEKNCSGFELDPEEAVSIYQERKNG